jgi:hypothetical protein
MGSLQSSSTLSPSLLPQTPWNTPTLAACTLPTLPGFDLTRFLARCPSSWLYVVYYAKVSQTNGSVNIAGVLDDNKLTVSLHSSGGPLLKRGTLLKRICHRLNNQDVRIIGHIPGHTHGRCEVLAGETNEGLKLVIESHRCFEDDPQGNASAQKV